MNMKEKMKSALERFSKAIVQPLMYLSVAGTVLILGILLTNGSITAKIPFLQAAPFQLVGKLIYNCLMFLINNLSVIFCVGIAGALAKKNKGHASLIALMSYFLFLNANNITLSFIGRLAEMGPLGLYGTGQSTVLGIQVLDMGVFSGITLGCLTGYVFNKYGEKQFKGYFSMFSGVRFPFFLLILLSLFLGFGASYVWPVVQRGISALTDLIKSSGNVGLYIYGLLNKLLVPTGLHHLVYAPFQFTDVGGTLVLGDQIISGAYPIRVAEMNMPGVPFHRPPIITATHSIIYSHISESAWPLSRPRERKTGRIQKQSCSRLCWQPFYRQLQNRWISCSSLQLPCSLSFTP